MSFFVFDAYTITMLCIALGGGAFALATVYGPGRSAFGAWEGRT